MGFAQGSKSHKNLRIPPKNIKSKAPNLNVCPRVSKLCMQLYVWPFLDEEKRVKKIASSLKAPEVCSGLQNFIKNIRNEENLGKQNRF